VCEEREEVAGVREEGVSKRGKSVLSSLARKEDMPSERKIMQSTPVVARSAKSFAIAVVAIARRAAYASVRLRRTGAAPRCAPGAFTAHASRTIRHAPSSSHYCHAVTTKGKAQAGSERKVGV